MVHKRKDNRGGHRPNSVTDPSNPKRFDNLPPEELKEIQRRGGIKAAENRRKKREMKDNLGMLLDLAMKPGPVTQVGDMDIETLSLEDIMSANLSVEDSLHLAMILKARNGSTHAYELIRDTSGNKPVDRQETRDVTPVIITGEAELED